MSLALVVFIYVQITGFRKLGVGGYFYHLVGSPTDVMGWCLVPLMLPLHVIGELAKPVSLSLRLFGNIMGEDVLIAVFTGLGVLTLSAIKSPIGIPLEFPFIFLGLLLSHDPGPRLHASLDHLLLADAPARRGARTLIAFGSSHNPQREVSRNDG